MWCVGCGGLWWVAVAVVVVGGCDCGLWAVVGLIKASREAYEGLWLWLWWVAVAVGCGLWTVGGWWRWLWWLWRCGWWLWLWAVDC